MNTTCSPNTKHPNAAQFASHARVQANTAQAASPGISYTKPMRLVLPVAFPEPMLTRTLFAKNALQTVPNALPTPTNAQFAPQAPTKVGTTVSPQFPLDFSVLLNNCQNALPTEVASLAPTRVFAPVV